MYYLWRRRSALVDEGQVDDDINVNIHWEIMEKVMAKTVDNGIKWSVYLDCCLACLFLSTCFQFWVHIWPLWMRKSWIPMINEIKPSFYCVLILGVTEVMIVLLKHENKHLFDDWLILKKKFYTFHVDMVCIFQQCCCYNSQLSEYVASFLQSSITNQQNNDKHLKFFLFSNLVTYSYTQPNIQVHENARSKDKHL